GAQEGVPQEEGWAPAVAALTATSASASFRKMQEGSSSRTAPSIFPGPAGHVPSSPLRLGWKGASATPVTKPPTCAQDAVDIVASDWNRLARAPKYWYANQTPSRTIAGIRITKMNTSVEIGAFGNQTAYAPSTPAIAPDAPTIGTSSGEA